MALAADRLLVEQEGKLLQMPAAAAKIFKNALVKVNAAGYAAPAAGEVGSQFAGIAYEAVDNSAGSAGDKFIRVEQSGVWELPGSGFAQANVGDTVYAADDDTVTVTQGTGSKQVVGIIVKFISSTKVAVKLTPYAGVGAA